MSATSSGNSSRLQVSISRLNASGAAVQRSAGMIADVDLEPEAGEAEVGAHQRVGKVERREVELLAGQVLGPRLIERDDERRRRIELRGRVLIALAATCSRASSLSAERVAVASSARRLARDGLCRDSASTTVRDVVEHEAEQAVEVAFPQIGPIGHAAIVELQERAAA